MSGEFSLLNHLGVSVPEGGAANPCRPAGNRNECRVWSPVHRPPQREDVRGIASSHPPRKAAAKTKFADPTGDVLLGRENGKEVEYVIYNSKVPSIYGINKQLADARRREQAEQQERERLMSQPPVTLEDDTQRDASRRRLLSDLHRCNMEQAQLKREERRREDERRVAREADYLRSLEAQEQRSEQAARDRRAAEEAALCEANREMARRRRDAALAAHEADQAYVEQSYFSDQPEDEYSEIAARRVRALLDDNKMLAARARERREQERALDDMYAQRMAERAAAEASHEKAEVERARARARAYAAEMEQAAAARRSQPVPISDSDECPVFLAPEKDEVKLEAKRAHMAEAIREENRRLAEQKRAEAAAQAAKEKALVQQLIDEEVAAERKDREREALRKMKQQEEYRVAMERAIAAKHARLDAERDARTQPMPLFFDDAQTERNEAARRRKEQQLAEEHKATAEKRRAARLQQEARQIEAERVALEEEARAVKNEDDRRRQRTTAENARLQRDLERQIAQHHQQRGAEHGAVGGLEREPVEPPRELYRCPVTGRLLPAEAFEFGRGR